MQAVDSKNWNALVLEHGDFSQDDMAVLVTKDPALESTTSSAVNSLAPSSAPAKKNGSPGYVLIRFYAAKLLLSMNYCLTSTRFPVNKVCDPDYVDKTTTAVPDMIKIALLW
jgi:hypothetical protein